MPPSDGYKIVLTADATLMARYDLLFDGMLAASQTTTTPGVLMKTLLMPKAKALDGRASVAPLGIRRIEAALLQGGFTPTEVAVVPPWALQDAIGPNTQVVGIGGGEPAGGGMNSSTMVGVAGGTIYPLAMYRKLLKTVRKAVDAKAPSAKVVFGGPGAWQIAQEKNTGIDHVVLGYAEAGAAAVFRDLCDGKPLPATIEGVAPEPEDVPAIFGPSTMGVVEVSRGCGLGCTFCTIAKVPMRHIPIQTIVRDARTNVAGRQPNIAALSEDFFRYGATGIKPDPAAVIKMLEALREVDGLKLIQIDHTNIVSISQFDNAELRAVHALLTKGQRHDYLWVNLGVESASGELLAAHGGRAKIGANDPSQWAEVCRREIERLCACGFFPMVSLIMCLPGETPEHVRQTLEFVRSLRGMRVSVFPMLFAPLVGTHTPTVDDLTRLHWDLIKESYRFNFKWVPKMYWDNQVGAGVGLGKRLAIQALGKGQVLEWSALFALRGRKAK
jgi:radical SAM superfamily enzyme YgiQ (UPF0313 family)